jgi:hypothetical protein
MTESTIQSFKKNVVIGSADHQNARTSLQCMASISDVLSKYTEMLKYHFDQYEKGNLTPAIQALFDYFDLKIDIDFLHKILIKEEIKYNNYSIFSIKCTDIVGIIYDYCKDVDIERELSRFEMSLPRPISFFEKHTIEYKNTPYIPSDLEKNIGKSWLYLIGEPSDEYYYNTSHLKKCSKVDWDQVSKNTTVSVSYLEKNIDKVNWTLLSMNPGIPIQFFERYLDKVDWVAISLNLNIPISMFRNNIDKVNWERLSWNPSVPDSFFVANASKIKWRDLSGHPRFMKKEFIKLFG